MSLYGLFSAIYFALSVQTTYTNIILISCCFGGFFFFFALHSDIIIKKSLKEVSFCSTWESIYFSFPLVAQNCP